MIERGGIAAVLMLGYLIVTGIALEIVRFLAVHDVIAFWRYPEMIEQVNRGMVYLFPPDEETLNAQA